MTARHLPPRPDGVRVARGCIIGIGGSLILWGVLFGVVYGIFRLIVGVS